VTFCGQKTRRTAAGRGPRKVRNHVARIKEALEARSIAGVVTYAHRAGLVGAV